MLKPVIHTERSHHRTTLIHHAGLVQHGKPVAPLAMTMRYDAHDPFAVRMRLQMLGADALWTLSRETLLLGLHRATGRGDATVWPVRRPHHHPLLRLRLGPPTHWAVVQTERRAVAHWLRITLKLVPQGAEGSHLNWDEFLDPLLGKS
ncbi:SsgA family sporulation/cell division regulator [Streptomyces sp. SID14478]|uniref:SsgA family sporulation/cell division regulator n=1 Tax=Streptomyces sp. SID14478 TaxID=2706073 RepID=UPI0013E060CC|nr:SsgA family sporulation/cell division regulator [Streptomyces sp. SID14478]NEB80855.1 SsgA family sporulation/cell division regulator [Streptomyces sp. SID14478]